MKHLEMITPLKIGILFFIICLIFSIFTFGVAYVESREAIKETTRDELETVAHLISQRISSDEIEGITAGDENTIRYQTIRDKLRAIRSEKKEIMNIYIWERAGDNLAILVDDDDDPSPIGTLYEARPEIIAYTLQAFSGVTSDPDFTYEEWGASLSGYAPILNRTGYPIAILGVDMRMEDVLSRMDRVSGELLVVQIFGIILIVLFILLISPKIVAIIHKPRTLFVQLFENSADSIIIIQDRQIREVNSAAEQLAGVERVRLIGSDPFVFILPDDREKAFKLFHLIETGVSTFEEIEVRSNILGTPEKWLDIRSFPIQWKNQPAVISMIRDISASMAYQKALSESEERYAAIVNNAPEPVIIHKDGIVLFVNRAGEETSGYSYEELRGSNILEMLTPDSAEKVKLQMISRKQGEPKSDYEVNFVHKNGSILTLIVKGTEIIYENQSVILVHLVDITERKRIELALQKANQQLNLMTNITRHDILNGITALQGYLDIVSDDDSLLQSKKFIQKLQDIVFQIQEQIEFTRDYQQIGMKEPFWQNVGVILTRLSPPDGVKIQVKTCDYEIFADLLLEKVFYNLLDNSLRHGKTVSIITVDCQKINDDLVIVYSDNGVGIPPHEKEIVFTSGWGKNTGYGMFLVREILAITDIRISETGEYGAGVRFEILVPDGKFRRSFDEGV